MRDLDDPLEPDNHHQREGKSLSFSSQITAQFSTNVTFGNRGNEGGEQEKENWRWLENMCQSTMVLDESIRCAHIGDRESDIYELFYTAYDLCTRLLPRTCVVRLAGDGRHMIATAM